jgi:hypothetical protein
VGFNPNNVVAAESGINFVAFGDSAIANLLSCLLPNRLKGYLFVGYAFFSQFFNYILPLVLAKHFSPEILFLGIRILDVLYILWTLLLAETNLPKLLFVHLYFMRLKSLAVFQHVRVCSSKCIITILFFFCL